MYDYLRPPLQIIIREVAEITMIFLICHQNGNGGSYNNRQCGEQTYVCVSRNPHVQDAIVTSLFPG